MTLSGSSEYRFLIAEASSRRAAAISVPFLNFTLTLPRPTYESEETSTAPEIRDSTPSSFDVTSASTVSGEAPG